MGPAERDTHGRDGESWLFRQILDTVDDSLRPLRIRFDGLQQVGHDCLCVVEPEYDFRDGLVPRMIRVGTSPGFGRPGAATSLRLEGWHLERDIERSSIGQRLKRLIRTIP